MKAKTARRFLSRNEWKMAKAQLFISEANKSFLKRWKRATYDCFKKEVTNA